MTAPSYRDPLREKVHFYSTDSTLAMDQAEAVYTSLRRTPFVSLYGAANCGDDLAEYVAVYHWTQELHRPYRIVMRNGSDTRFVYEPMNSDLVRSRIDQMKQFYEKAADAVSER
jgi:hypothetical protein